MFSKVVVVNPPNPPKYISNKDSMGGFGQLLDMCIALVWLLDSAKRALQNLKAA